MQRIDAYFLYSLGHTIHRISDVRARFWEGQPDVQTKKAALYSLRPAYEALTQFIDNSVFRVRVSFNPALTLKRHLERLIQICDAASESDLVEYGEVADVRGALSEFEAVLKAELGTMGIFLVAPKNAMDTLVLIEAGEQAFPPSLGLFVPDAIPDARAAMSCIAFELPTAAAFHLHRANEAVLKAYRRSISSDPVTEKATMGQVLSEMEGKKLGKEEIRSALRDIVRLHRNPTIHPEQTLRSVEEAINLYGAIRSVMGFMLIEIEGLQEPGDGA